MIEDDEQSQRVDPPVPTSMKQVIEVFGTQSSDEPVEADLGARGCIREIKELEREIKCLEERKQWLKDRLAVKMMNHAYMVNPDDGEVIITWKTSTARRFNQARFKKENPKLLDEYMDEREYRTFLIK